MKRYKFTLALIAALIATPAAAQLFNWTGFYYGGSAGYNQHHTKWWDDGGWVSPGLYKQTVDGAIFGLDGGYNWQFGNWVFGIETDYAYSTAKGTYNWTFNPYPVHMDANWLGTTRLRAGYAFDKTLIYVTGGLAYSDSSTQIATTFGNWNWNDWNIGWAAGGGIEQALANNPRWSVRLEGLWLQFKRYDFEGGIPSYPMRVQNSDLIIRIGLNYRP